MKFNWTNLIIAVATAVLSLWNITLPDGVMDLITKLLDGLQSSPLATAGFAGGLAWAGTEVYKGRGSSLHHAAKKLRRSLGQAQEAADELGADATVTAAISKANEAATPLILASLKKEKQKKQKQDDE